jgi:hypothetical protein
VAQYLRAHPRAKRLYHQIIWMLTAMRGDLAVQPESPDKRPFVAVLARLSDQLGT